MGALARGRRRGIALLTTIWLITVLVILAAGLAATVHGETAVTRNFAQLARARWAARAGVHRAEAQLLTLATDPYSDPTTSRLELLSSSTDPFLTDLSYDTVVEDEAGKINLNTASQTLLETFFPTDVAASLLSWRSPAASAQANGAGDAYYMALDPPYHCKSAPFDTVGEITMVDGVTADLLQAPVTADGRTLQELLTVSSWDNNTDADGQARLNLTRATQPQLQSAFPGLLTQEEVAAILARRSRAAFTSPADLVLVPGLAVSKIAQMYDRLTTSTATQLHGLINLNTAPPEVLAAVPGLDTSMAAALVAHRPFTQVGDMLLVEGITPGAFRQAAGLLTMRSAVFGVTSTGQDADGLRGTITCLLQLENQDTTPSLRVLYWREQ